MSISEPSGAEQRTATGRPRLHLVDALEEKNRKNRLWSVLANGALSLRRRLRLAKDAMAKVGLVRRLPGWWSRFCGWLRPVVKAVSRAGLALPVWLITDARAQRLIGAGVRSAGRAVREGLYLSSDFLTWTLWRLGSVGQEIARRYGFLVERIETTVEALGNRVAGWLQVLHADRLHIRVVHDLAGVLGLVRGIAGFVPGPWRLAVGVIAFATAGGTARAQLIAGLRWLLTRVQGAFSLVVPSTSGSPAIATASGPSVQTRAAHSRPSRNRQRSRRRR